ncbi:MAG: hypothetical protein WD738_03980 [Pirellulales bacterium]
MAADVAGIDVAAVVGWAPAAAKLADEGGAAGCKPPDSATWGVDCVEGSSGAADRASTDASSAASFCFHHAHRGLDWQPANPATRTAIHNARVAVIFMLCNSGLSSADQIHTSQW